MRGVKWVLWLTAAGAALAQPAIPQEEYRARRAELRKALPEGIVALFGRTEKREPDETMPAFRQDASFLYLTGWEEPGAALLLWPPSGEALFLPVRDERADRYTGRKTTAEDPNARAVTGFEEVLPQTKLEGRLLSLADSHPKIYALAEQAPRWKELLPLREVLDARPAIARLRMKKSAREIELIQKSIDVTVAAQRAAWKRARPGAFEYEVAAAFTAAVMERGCANGFPPIVASGPNGPTLHYWRNSRRIETGELLVMDVGAECSGYTADLTRTLPISGKFTARQKELYEIVLGAQRAILAAIKPGIVQGLKRDTPNSLYKVACDYIESHGQRLLHGVSHHVGLRVHDAGTADQPLEAGMVVTVEPGIYLPEENLGIRIEDMVLVTESGATVLSGALPKEAAEIEKAMAGSEPRPQGAVPPASPRRLTRAPQAYLK